MNDNEYFNYIETTNNFIDYTTALTNFKNLPLKIRTQLSENLPQFSNTNTPNFLHITQLLRELLPQLETTHNNWRAQKRAIYIDYYANINTINSRLMFFAVAGLVLCILVAILYVSTLTHSIRYRLKKLLSSAHAVYTGKTQNIHLPEKQIDELDEVTYYLHKMTDRLVDIIATKKVIEGTEKERKRIAMDLHDHILADLSSVTRNLHNITASTKPKENIDNLTHDINNIINNIRNVIDDLHPHLIYTLGLIAAIESFLQKNNGSNQPECYLSKDISIDDVLNEHQKINIYRITIEAIQNVLQHAQCSKYEITLRKTKTNLILSIEDNGKGFDHQVTPNTAQHGLCNIRERAKIISATVMWHASRFNSGTCFVLSLPLTTESN